MGTAAVHTPCRVRLSTKANAGKVTMRRAGFGLLAGCVVLCACGAREGAGSSDAGVARTSAEEARALRRRLREERPAPIATSKRGKLPFALAENVQTFAPSIAPSKEAIATPTPPASGPLTFLMPSPIAPMADHSGRYVMSRRDSSTFFTQTGLTFSLSSPTSSAKEADPSALGGKSWGLHCTLVGAREGALTAEDPRPGRVHHYVGAPSSWATEIPTYGRLVWEDVYPGVDMVAEPARGGAAYRFVLSPGAKVSDLVMRWEGATAVRVADDGLGVHVETEVGVLRVRGLRAFAIAGAGKQRLELPARHVVRGSDVRLEVDGWDGRQPLVIDPTIAWSSYLGGGSSDIGSGIAVDGSGNVLVTGTTSSTDFPTSGGFDTTIGAGGYQDAFVTKVSGSGALVWSSYLGGGSSDIGYGIAVDGSGNAFVTGDSDSSDFPTSGGFDTTLSGFADAFVTKVSGTGVLLWSSYLGGGSTDRGSGIAVDGSGNTLVTGYTDSTDFPTSAGFDTTYGGGRDAFVTKVSGTGVLLWSSYLGGAAVDHGTGVAVDGSGNALVTGATGSTDFPTSGFDTTYSGGLDAFVTKVSAAGALVWSSYLGGSAQDDGTAIAVDGSGNALVTGRTQSTDFPTSGGFDTTYGGDTDAFVTKVSGAGALLWSSYLGGSANESWFGKVRIAVDGSGNALVTGYTTSTDFPTNGGFDTTYGGRTDAFVAKVSGAGVLLWSSYLGGGADDDGNAIAVDGSGNALVTGFTYSTDFPTSGGFDTTFSDYADAFVTKLQFASLGASCTVSAECRSSLCVDGVCCDKACNGACEACTTAKKGGGADGTCGPIANGSDPDNECSPQSCSAGIVTKAQVCNGASTCAPSGTTPCGLYACAGSACATTCAGAPDCIAPATCASGACIIAQDAGTDVGLADTESNDAPSAPDAADAAIDAVTPDATIADTGANGADTTVLETATPDTALADSAAPETVAPTDPRAKPVLNGDAQSCTSASACASGFCVDGVCCDSACSGTCHSCALPQAPGKCSLQPLGYDLRGECQSDRPCFSTCGTRGECVASFAGARCQEPKCTSKSAGTGWAVCSGFQGSCLRTDAITFDCLPYSCEPAFGACRESCRTSDDCAVDFLCETSTAKCVPGPPAAESSGCDCATPHTSRTELPLSAWLALAFSLGAVGITRTAARRRRA